MISVSIIYEYRPSEIVDKWKKKLNTYSVLRIYEWKNRQLPLREPYTVPKYYFEQKLQLWNLFLILNQSYAHAGIRAEKNCVVLVA